MFSELLKKIFGTAHERQMRLLAPLVQRINELERRYLAMSDGELQGQTALFKERLSRGESLDDLLPEAFAVCREASRRILNMRHYDVQLIGGIVLHQGKIAEMRTGEGKTLVATLPVYLNALAGHGVHVVTVNDYLAKRDAEWMGRIYRWLGLSVGVIVHELNDRQRQESYRSDITYGTNNEFGFDYLRDNMKYSLDDMVQRELNFAIVDECDSILIDEARTPLIISGPSEQSTEKYYIINQVVPKLIRDVHFKIEEKTKSASLTDEGNALVEKLLKIDNLYDPENIELLHHISQGLKAYHLYHRDVDYVVKDSEIIIVDEFTGRLMPGRRWSDGLHQAIEAKEGVPVKSENQTLASITFQNYFRLYKKLAGMTGTAETEATEFKKIYNLDVVVIPTNKPVRRIDHQDVIYKNERAKWRAIAQDIRQRHEKGQPILVGTTSIEKSELLSQFLKQEKIPHQVLNAKHHEREAEIIAQAGRFGAVTIATNMAGRGTDIILGGNPEGLAKKECGKSEGPEYEVCLQKWRTLCEEERKKVVEAGGLCIIGTERHESRRIDNQLRGRAGRQGDPGESRFYLSLEDNLMRIFNGETMQKVMETLNIPEDEPITHRWVTKSIESSQKKVEGHNFEIRKHLLEYDDVMNKQRMIVYGLRRKILWAESLEEDFKDILSDVLSAIVDQVLPEGQEVTLDHLKSLNQAIHAVFGVSPHLEVLSELTEQALLQAIKQVISTAYQQQCRSLGALLLEVQRMLWLQTIDQRWKEHLLFIDRLREGIGLRGFAQKDPMVEYKKEAFYAFERLLANIKKEVVEKFMRVQIVVPDAAVRQFEALKSQNQKMRQDVQYHSSETSASSFLGTGGSGNVEAPRRVLSEPEAPRLNRAQRRRLKKGR
ncbi:MAG: preprotein translocase subunit SecA [Bdellovibrionaceae bacterium]|nr:preprotein translocase subunit SecA [Pseudobdellovibrionaceae bacterium]MDW8190322.1 preprotein translocase subunit SecA [Pseudobdellovibrionaceae bacterium]